MATYGTASLLLAVASGKSIYMNNATQTTVRGIQVYGWPTAFGSLRRDKLRGDGRERVRKRA